MVIIDANLHLGALVYKDTTSWYDRYPINISIGGTALQFFNPF